MRQAAGVVVRSVSTGAVLLVFNRWRRAWEYPGGGVSPADGGSPTATALRELAEETGIRLAAPSWKLGTVGVQTRTGRELEYATFAACVAGELPVSLSIEHSTYAWVQPDQLDDLPMRSYVRDRLRCYLQDARWRGALAGSA